MARTEIEDNEIVGRVRLANRWLVDFRKNDIASSNAYLDANGPGMLTDEDDWDEEREPYFRATAEVPDVVPIGQPNYMAMNTEVSAAAVSSQLPKLHIRANESKDKGFPGAAEIVQQAWKQAWVNGGYKRQLRGAYQKRKICGLGCIWYRWDQNYGFVIENVTSNRFFFDPHATNMNRLRYGGVAIHLPLSEAIVRYDPDGKEEFFSSDYDLTTGEPQGKGFFAKAVATLKQKLMFRGEDDTGAASLERQTCKIYIYFDRDVEAHIYNDQVIWRGSNLYGTVPLLFKELFIDPRDRILPLGMGYYARGLNQQVVWLSAIAGDCAKNGAVITLFDTNKIKGPERTALENGTASQLIGISAPLNPNAPPIMRIPGEPLPPGYSVARAEAQAALDGIMGASASARGETPPGVTATQAMLTESRSNAMMVDEQEEFEGWVSAVARAFVSCTQKFGGPVAGEPTPNEAVLIWHAFMAVQDVNVVSGSTKFSNPATELTATMQLFTTVTQSWPLWMELVNKGEIDKVPNIKMLFMDLLIAFNRSNTDEYWMPAPQPASGPATLPVDVVRWMQANYKDAPDDIKRQIEQSIGLQPSQAPPDTSESDTSLKAVALEHHIAEMKIEADRQKQQSEHAHDYRLKALDIAAKAAAAPVEPPETGKNGKGDKQ